MEAQKAAKVEAGDEINSLDAANVAVLENGIALRIQPPAPKATRYYFNDDRMGWSMQKCGHGTAQSVEAESVRRAVKRAIPKNDSMGGGGVTAVEQSEKDRYA